MSKAASPSSKLTRRAAIGALSATAIAPLGGAALTSALHDPIFAAIAAHKTAYAALDQACRLVSDLEGNIPEERRKEWYREDRTNGVGIDDDPRWTAAHTAYWAAADAETQGAWALAHARPASRLGIAALLRYAAEYEDMGCEWPSLPGTDDGEEEWMMTLHRNLAAALETMA